MFTFSVCFLREKSSFLFFLPNSYSFVAEPFNYLLCPSCFEMLSLLFTKYIYIYTHTYTHTHTLGFVLGFAFCFIFLSILEPYHAILIIAFLYVLIAHVCFKCPLQGFSVFTYFSAK